jgi:signal transduction histidine kinase
MTRGGITTKLIALVVAGGVAILGVLLSYSYGFTRSVIVRNAGENAGNLTNATVNRVEAILAATQKVPANLAAVLEHGTYTQDELLELVRVAVESNPEIYGATVAFEPYAFDRKRQYFSPYYYKRQGELHFTYLGGPNYQYFTLDWYQIPKETGRPEWSEPYFDEGGGDALMSTYSVPFYQKVGGERRFRGIVTADISLDWLTSIVSRIRVLDTGYAFLISKNGMIVTHPQRNLIMNETLFTLAEARGSAAWRRIGRQMIAGRSGFELTRCLLRDADCYLAYAPIPANGWSLGALFPRAELLADLTRLNRTVVALVAAGAVFLLVVVAAIARSITRPLVALAAASEEIAHGNLDSSLPAARTSDEVGRLAGAFAEMQRELRRRIDQLKETSAARERAARDALALAEECKRAEAQIAEYSHTLEDKVAARTAELRDKNAALEDTVHELEQTQERLVVQEKLASLGALTAGIAHEIKNPLNFVNNFAELSGELAGELREVLGNLRSKLSQGDLVDLDEILDGLQQNVVKVREHGQRADRIVAGMLEHSRGASGDRRPTNLNTLVADHLNLAYHGMRAQSSAFNVHLETRYDESLPPLAVVPEDLGRVFLNVFNNACYALRQKQESLGGAYTPVIRVSTADAGSRVEVRVRDNGPGIPRGALDKIFNPFFTTKPAGQGTGLGLSISYDIVVRQHHGELRVESEEGEGAEFVISLPKEKA